VLNPTGLSGGSFGFRLNKPETQLVHRLARSGKATAGQTVNGLDACSEKPNDPPGKPMGLAYY